MNLTQLVLAIVLLFVSSASTAYAQLGTPHYKLQSRSQLRTLLLRNQYDAQAIYDLTILANQQGWLSTILKTGDEMMAKNRNDAHAQALSAFGVATGLWARDWSWPVDKSAGDVWARQTNANVFRGESLKLKNPGIQLMAAIAKSTSPGMSEMDEALRLFQQVIKQEPKWADAYYWYQRAILLSEEDKGKAQAAAAAKQCLTLLNKAERLDSGLRGYALFDRYSCWLRLDNPRNALLAYNAYLRAYPGFAKDLEERWPGSVAKTRARLATQIQQQSS